MRQSSTGRPARATSHDARPEERIQCSIAGHRPAGASAPWEERTPMTTCVRLEAGARRSVPRPSLTRPHQRLRLEWLRDAPVRTLLNRCARKTASCQRLLRGSSRNAFASPLSRCRAPGWRPLRSPFERLQSRNVGWYTHPGTLPLFHGLTGSCASCGPASRVKQRAPCWKGIATSPCPRRLYRRRLWA